MSHVAVQRFGRRIFRACFEPQIIRARPVYGLTTAEIHYYRPDTPSLLHLSIWQEYDLAPDFPVLFECLDYWRRGIQAAVHSLRIAHGRLIRPAEWHAVSGVIAIQ